MPEFEVKTLEENFGSDVEIVMLVKKDLVEKFKEKLINAANGKLKLDETPDIMEDFS